MLFWFADLCVWDIYKQNNEKKETFLFPLTHLFILNISRGAGKFMSFYECTGFYCFDVVIDTKGAKWKYL